MYEIQVPTPFEEFSELAENFASRVDENRIMLPAADPVAEGEPVQFSVTLADGSAVLAGVGRCSGAFDNGEERAAEHRYDVVLDSLELDDIAQVYFERLAMAQAGMPAEGPGTEEIEVDALDVAEVPSAGGETPPQSDEQAEVEASVDQFAHTMYGMQAPVAPDQSQEYEAVANEVVEPAFVQDVPEAFVEDVAADVRVQRGARPWEQ